MNPAERILAIIALVILIGRIWRSGTAYLRARRIEHDQRFYQARGMAPRHHFPAAVGEHFPATTAPAAAGTPHATNQTQNN